MVTGVLGMALYAGDRVLASRPCAAGGAYNNCMPNSCAGCRFDPTTRVGDDGCPFTTLYRDFLMRQQKKPIANMRLATPYRTLSPMSEADRSAIRDRAEALRNGDVSV